ncbi:MAG: hypothetical protein JWN30_2809 [Bacilli bacterium]|nr:hypothetical protein [Bacilli bacterium]
MNHNGCKVIAHRGASAYAPENTMPAFQLAMEQGADGIELDVQMTRDGELVVVHDERLGRTVDLDGYVYEIDWAVLSHADAGGWFHSQYRGTRIPRLEEVIRHFAGTLLNIELKNSVVDYVGLEVRILQLIDHYGLYDRVVVSSFNHESMAILKQLDARVKTGLLFDAVLHDPVRYAISAGADCLHPACHALRMGQLDQLTANGIQVNTWTVDDEQVMRVLCQTPVSWIITNYPDRLRRIMDTLKP